MQNRYLNQLKNNQSRLKQQHNAMERMMLNDKYNQESQFKYNMRLKTMHRQQLINDQNKYLHQIKDRHRSLDKQGETGVYKENPIEYRLRNEQLRKFEQNRIREKDILQYNNNAAKMKKMSQEHNKVRDKYYSKEFNDFVEKQSINHLLNLTSQQEKYETKRQYKDFLVLKDRTLHVKNIVDDLIAKYNEAGNDNSTDMKELLQMQSSIRK